MNARSFQLRIFLLAPCIELIDDKESWISMRQECAMEEQKMCTCVRACVCVYRLSRLRIIRCELKRADF